MILVLIFLVAGCARTGDARIAQDPTRPAGAPSTLASTEQDVTPRTGPVGDGDATSRCVESYSAQTIGNRSFAFDGTIVDIDAGGTNKPDMGSLDTAAVTFDVNEWFKGGPGERVTVDVVSPTSSASTSEPPVYDVGTRLLVSGEPRWGGEPLADAIAWSCGGFTRYYEAGVAEEWRRGTS